MHALTHYKGFSGVVTYIDTDEDLITGELANIENVITFQARTPAGLQQAFQESVDDYLQLCAERGLEPHKTHSGKVALRLSPEVHGAALVAARGRGISLNTYLGQAIMGQLRVEGYLSSEVMAASEAGRGVRSGKKAKAVAQARIPQAEPGPT